MINDLILTPSGHIRLITSDDDAISDVWVSKITKAFGNSQANGLFELVANKLPELPLSPVFSFWHRFASMYMRELCEIPGYIDEIEEPIAVPPNDVLLKVLGTLPPMKGGEYLTVDVLKSIWKELDKWVRDKIVDSNKGIAKWLKKNATIWQQIGRVCFHLAENKQDREYPFAFLATYAPELSVAGKVQYKPLGQALQEFAGNKHKKQLINLLMPVSRASEKVAFVKELVDTGDIFYPISWTINEAYEFLKSIEQLEASGLLVKIPDWWKKRARPRVSVTIGEKKTETLGLNSLLDFNVQLTLGNQKLTKKEIERLMEADDGLTYMKGQWIEVDKEKLSQALQHWKKVEKKAHNNGVSFIEGMRFLAGMPANIQENNSLDATENQDWAFVNAGSWLSKTLASLTAPSNRAKNKINNGFRGKLRHYQEIGHDWLQLITNLGLGGCLADDMGLGKTIQIISLLLSIKMNKHTNKPSLLVLPASLLANWKSEISKFAPNINAKYIHLSEMNKTDMRKIAEKPEQHLKNTDIVLTTYGMLTRQKWLLEIDWHLVILDEAQAIKNPSTNQTKVVKKLKSHARIALTGTPIENRLSDLWSLFDFLCPGLLGSASKFKKFIKSIADKQNNRYSSLRRLVAPYILRRMKTDKSIISDLPDKTEIKAFCGLSKRQAILYEKHVLNLKQAIAETEGIKRRGLVLAYLMKFKQICNHPSQLLGDGDYNKKDSGKFAKLVAICEEIMSRQEKVLIFTQFREITDAILTLLSQVFGHQGLVLHGGTAVNKRKQLVDLFQQEDGPAFFVLSLKAGGTGLNLTAASHVIHFDRWWNPAVESQATDRAFRIGQKKNVIVHKFVCQGTIEEKIDALIEEKTKLATSILKTGAESLLTEMSNDELIKAVTLDINRATI